MKPVNLYEKLLAARRRQMQESKILFEVRNILAENEVQRDSIRKSLVKGGQQSYNNFEVARLEPAKIFHVSQIRKVCIDYRLRFLDSSFFKDGIPEEAITKIRELEKSHDTKLQGFRIAAPTKSFQLHNYDDPLLFAPICDDYYYFVHKWGKDMTSMRKWMVLPIKNLGNFILFCTLISLLITVVLPASAMSEKVPMASVIIFLFLFKSVFAVMMWGFFMQGKRFNNMMWNSKFYNH